LKFTEKKISGVSEYEGAVFGVRRDTVELSNGRRAFREVVEHSGGVVIIPLTHDGGVIMVRQYRYPVAKELIEAPAGKLEPGEGHLECARRELSEETGASARRLVYLGGIYPSPGFCEEVLHIYLAAELEMGDSHPDADELLEVLTVPLDRAVEMIMSGEIADAKTAVGVFKAREYLRSGGR
jgi:ADP-ribose pyrophosphatase